MAEGWGCCHPSACCAPCMKHLGACLISQCFIEAAVPWLLLHRSHGKAACLMLGVVCKGVEHANYGADVARRAGRWTRGAPSTR